MHRVLTCLFFLVFLSAQSFPAIAVKQVTVKPLDFSTPIMIVHSPKQPNCVVGNTNPAGWSIPNFILPPEDYAVVFDPQASTCLLECPRPPWLGIKVSTIHILLQSAAACDLTMSVGVRETEFPNSPSCAEPGPVWCESEQYVVSLPSAGFWDVSLSVNCPCLGLRPPLLYLLGLHIESACAMVPDLVTDAGPATQCTNYNNYGLGWMDILMQYPVWPGNLVIYADAECCDHPIPVEGKSWGAIKNIYQD